jgi:hypothetical protein
MHAMPLQDYRGAIAMYTQGAEAAGLETPAAAPLLGNRAAARMMILQYQQAVEDCDAALKCDPLNPKVNINAKQRCSKSLSFSDWHHVANSCLFTFPSRPV